MADSLKNTLLAVKEGRMSLTQAMKLLNLKGSSSASNVSNRVVAMREGRIGRSKGGSVKRTK
jgi:hypothetical protein